MDKVLFPDHNPEDHDLLVRIDKTVEIILERIKDQNGRIRSLEKWKWMQTGALFLIAVVFGVVVRVW